MALRPWTVKCLFYVYVNVWNSLSGRFFFFFLSKKNSFGVKALKSDLFIVQHDLPYPNRFIPYPDRKHVLLMIQNIF